MKKVKSRGIANRALDLMSVATVFLLFIGMMF